MRKETIHCDVCGRQKQETNHWWMAIPIGESGIDKLLIQPNDADANGFDLCGSECVQRKVSEFLEGKA